MPYTKLALNIFVPLFATYIFLDLFIFVAYVKDVMLNELDDEGLALYAFFRAENFCYLGFLATSAIYLAVRFFFKNKLLPESWVSD